MTEPRTARPPELWSLLMLAALAQRRRVAEERGLGPVAAALPDLQVLVLLAVPVVAPHKVLAVLVTTALVVLAERPGQERTTLRVAAAVPVASALAMVLMAAHRVVAVAVKAVTERPAAQALADKSVTLIRRLEPLLAQPQAWAPRPV